MFENIKTKFHKMEKKFKNAFEEGGYLFESQKAKFDMERLGVAMLSRQPMLEEDWREHMMLHDHARDSSLVLPHLWLGRASDSGRRFDSFTEMVVPRSRPLLERMKRASLAFWDELSPKEAKRWKSELWLEILDCTGLGHWASLEALPFGFDLRGKVWATQARLRVRHPSRRVPPHLRDSMTDQAALLMPEGTLFLLDKVELALMRLAQLGVSKAKMAQNLGMDPRTVAAKLERLAARLPQQEGLELALEAIFAPPTEQA